MSVSPDSAGRQLRREVVTRIRWPALARGYGALVVVAAVVAALAGAWR
jgi:hypothetical protein